MSVEFKSGRMLLPPMDKGKLSAFEKDLLCSFDIQSIRGKDEDLENLLGSKRAKTFARRVVESGNTYVQGVSLSRFTDSSLPFSVRRRLSIKSSPDIDATPVLTHRYWVLCADSEKRMSKACQDNAVAVVGGLMVKFRGRITALCFESFATNTGTFVAGNFYSPDEPAQQVLKEAFIEGNNRPDICGNWILMRGLIPTGYGEGLVEECRMKSTSLLPRIPEVITGFLTRAQYYENKKEVYPETNEC